MPGQILSGSTSGLIFEKCWAHKDESYAPGLARLQIANVLFYIWGAGPGIYSWAFKCTQLGLLHLTIDAEKK